MPTRPYEPILDRDMAKVLAKKLIDIASPALQEAVNYATNLYQRCQTSKEGRPDEAFPVLAAYLHVIQMVDSIEVLISNGCGAPSSLLLRSAFEADLTILYIVERQGKNRAYAWMVKNIMEQIDSLEAMDPTSQKGKELNEYWNKEGLGKFAEALSMPESAHLIRKHKENLRDPKYSDIVAEYARLTKTNRHVEWYSLFGGPRSLQQLAKHLNQLVMYQLLYVSSSRMAHVANVGHLTLPLEDGSIVLGPIRNPIHIANEAATSLAILLETTQAMLKEYQSDEMTSFRNWYGREVLAGNIALGNMIDGQRAWFHKKFIPKLVQNPL